MKKKIKNKLFVCKIDIEIIIELILDIQKVSGDIPWYHKGKTDPWDHIESSMALTIGGYLFEAQNAFKWLKNLQMRDGSWYSLYINGKPVNETRETNLSAYIAVGVFHYWLVTSDYFFLKFMWKTVSKAINFAIDKQNNTGEIFWAINASGKVDNIALLTGSSSIFMSLKCAIAIAKELNMDTLRWEKALFDLGVAIRDKKYLFNISKSRFSMDWFYPILSGAVSGKMALKRIETYWNKFVVKYLGVKCVFDQPWVTIAETSELVLSLSAIGNVKLACIVLKWIVDRVFDDGSLWCGFTYPDVTLWPKEKISWTNAVFLLALDSVYGFTSAKDIFNHSWWKKKYNIF